MSGRCRKNVKQNAVEKSVEKQSRETYKTDRHKVVQKSARKSNRVVDKLVNEEDCNARRKRGRENIECEKEEEEEELNTGKKMRGQAMKRGKNTAENIGSEKEHPQEVAAWVEEEELNTGTKKRGQARKRGKNTRENVESEKQDQEKTVSKSHRREKPRNRNMKGNEIASNMCHQCQRNDKGRVVRCTSCKTKRYCVPCMTTWYPGMPEVAFEESCPVCRQTVIAKLACGWMGQ